MGSVDESTGRSGTFMNFVYRLSNCYYFLIFLLRFSWNNLNKSSQNKNIFS